MNPISRNLTLGILLFALIALALSCGSEQGSEPDTTSDDTAPAAIADLRIDNTGCGSAGLAWTATGDDGTGGTATSYDLRYLSETVTEANWASATQCQGEPGPRAAGQAETFTVGNLVSGTTYYFACKVFDDEGNASDLSNNCSMTAGSAVIAWVNDGTGEDVDWVTSADQLSANWATSTCAEEYQYAIGTTQGGTDVLDWTSSGTSTAATRTGLTLSDGQAYYFSVRGRTGGTTGAPAQSDGITVDTGMPASQVGDLAAQVSALTFSVTWSGSDAASGIKDYDIQASTDGGGSWGYWLSATTLTESDFTGMDGLTYHFRSRARDNAGNVEAYPTSPDTYTTVTLMTGLTVAWVNDGLGEDADWTTSGDTLSANWPAVSGADSYEYAVGTTQGGTEFQDWTSAGTQTNMTLGPVGLVSGQAYYVSVRVIAGPVYGTPVSSDGITLDTGTPSSSVDSLDATTTTAVFSVSWSGNDTVSGVDHYDIQVSTDGGGLWGYWLSATTLTESDFTGMDGLTYHFRSRAYDNAGNVEAYPTSPDTYTTVTLTTGPTVAWVNDGLGDDADWTISGSTLSANWPTATGADSYEYAVGTTQGGTEFLYWTSAGTQTNMTLGPVGLVSGQAYYVSVRVVAGLVHGTAVTSDGITVDTSIPSSTVDSLDVTTTTATFSVSWSGNDTVSGVDNYDIQVKDNDGSWGDWLTGTTLTSSDFSGSVDHTYDFRSRAYDVAGNVEAYPTAADAHTCVTCSFAYAMQWGQEGTGDGDFKYPFAVAVDKYGDVYVTESDNSRVQVFGLFGGFLHKWGGSGFGDGQFSTAAGVAVDDSGYVYVTDFGNHRVQKFTSGGTYVTQWGSYGAGNDQLDYPRGIAVDDSGYVYVAEQGNDRIHKYTSDGTTVAVWGGNGSGDGQFGGLMGVAVAPSGNVYALDPNYSRVQEFTSNGTFVRKWGSSGSGDGQFYNASFLAVDGTGRVYVTDGGNYRVQVFTSDGKFLTEWGSSGTGDGQFDEPFGIAIGPDESVYVIDLENYRIQKFVSTCP